MTFFSDLFGRLAFRVQALRSLSERGSLTWGIVLFSVGFLAYALVRNSVYAGLPEILGRRSGPIGSFVDLKFVQTIFFVMLIYMPAVIVLSNALARKRPGFSIHREEYIKHSSALLALWGLLYLLTAPVQWLVPHFLIIGMLEISFGMLVRLMLVLVYTLWSIRHLNNLSTAQALGVFVLSWFTLLLYNLLTSF